jgi:F0F1-type ATP synthase epsilon subunit
MDHQKSDSTRLKVIARAPFQLYYEGAAKLVSAENRVGKFDILPGHADFFSVMTPCEVVIETDKDPVNINITNGIIGVRDDSVLLFLNI